MPLLETQSQAARGAGIRAARLAGLIAMTLPGLEACHGTGVSAQSRHIVIEREVLVRWPTERPTSLTRTPDGGFVLTAAGRTGQAIRIDANGNILWTYTDPFDPDFNLPYQSTFVAAVPVGNGNLLICGEKYTKDHSGSRGLIVILDRAGKVIDQRLVVPKDDPKYFNAGFNRCLPWGDGIALLGGATSGTTAESAVGSFWLMRLDGNLEKVWDTISTDLPGVEAVEAADHTLLVVGGAGARQQATVLRVDQTGATVARRTIPDADYAYPMRAVAPIVDFALIGYKRRSNPTLYRLNAQLKDVSPPKRTPVIFVFEGCGYVLADTSLALFGNVGGGSFRSAVAHINQTGGKADVVVPFRVPEPSDASYAVRDAVPVSSSEFVTIRDQVTRDPAQRGIVLSWISFK